MKSTLFKIIGVFLIVSLGSCKTANFSFLGLFNKKVLAKEQNKDSGEEDESFENTDVSISLSLLLNGYDNEEGMEVYILNNDGDKVLPHKQNNIEFYFPPLAPGAYDAVILYQKEIIKKEKLIIANDISTHYDIDIEKDEPTEVLVKDLFTFDSDDIQLRETNGSIVFIQLYDGESIEIKSGFVVELIGKTNYKQVTSDGGEAIFDNVEAGTYKLKLYDTTNKVAYNNESNTITVLEKTLKEINVYTFAGEYTDTTQIISGKIVDYNTGEAIPNSAIEVLGTNQKVTANGYGEFTLKVGAGAQQVKVKKNGYIANCIRVIAVPNSISEQVFYLVKPAEAFSVSNSGKKVAVTKNIELDIPEGALTEEKQISMTVLPEGLYFSGFPANINIPSFHMEPSGLKFNKPISVSFSEIEDIDDYEPDEEIEVDVFVKGKPNSEKKLSAKREGNKVVVTMQQFNSSYSVSQYSSLKPMANTAGKVRYGPWKVSCHVSASVKAHDKKMGSKRCYNNPFKPRIRKVRKFSIVSSCYGNANVSCNKCAKKALRVGIPAGRAYGCPKTLRCAAPNCRMSYLIAQIPSITFSGTLYRRIIILPGGRKRKQWKYVQRPKNPRCHSWTPKWDDKTICCNGAKCNKDNPNLNNKCEEWYCDNGVCKSRPTRTAKRLEKKCYECDPNTGKRGGYLCDKNCDKCINGECKEIKHYKVKTTTVTTTSKRCPPASNSTNTTTNVVDIPTSCPPPALPPTTTDTQTIPGAHDCEKTIITTVITWSIKKVNP